MKVLFVQKALLHSSPPDISAILTLNDLGHDVSLITEGLTDFWKQELTRRNISFFVVPKLSRKNVFAKVLSYVHFRRKTYSIVDKLYDDSTVLWVEGAHTIVALGKRLRKYKYFLQILELHEKFPMQLKAISKVISNAENVFMPEYNRACIYQCWFHLNKRPVVLPNKPYFLPQPEELDVVEKKYESLLTVFREKKVLLYQGHIHPERDLTHFVEAVNQLPDEFCMVLLGKDHGILKKYLEISDRIIHIDFIPSPDYLAFTRLCYLGIVCYDSRDLNNAYCAPNKIYEYGAYGKPIIGNDIPGLGVIKSFGAGAITMEIPEFIRDAVLTVSASYSACSKGSRSLFDSVDTKEIIRKSLTKNS